MYYVLSISDDYPESYWFNYDHGGSPNYLLFHAGKRFESLETPPVFRLDRQIGDERLSRLDFLMSDGGDFVSLKFAELMRTVAAKDVQLIEADVYVAGKKLLGYHIANIAHLVECIDMKNSAYTPLFRSDPGGPIKFSRMEFVDDGLKSHTIVRCKEDPMTIVVSEQFVQACRSAGIKGVEFLRNGVRGSE
ncbi:DUF1629 domain-containing protein [Massilia sp. METH4]|uniref:imm11 family protein n=1 Tax=Massilia sp. METH4 TaxID=3123041 RepID=UPI0030CAFA4F